MNAEQKQRAAELLAAWQATAYALHGDRMANLLQELVDAPETEPVARVTGYYAGYLSLATVDGRVLPTGTALYTAPPAPSVPEVLTATNPAQISSLAEPPADVARDAERYRWLRDKCRATGEHWGGRWSLVIEGPCPDSDESSGAIDKAIDAAIERQEGEKGQS